jgi:3(or 17)beta-hydroxysteroid dehydrogenase
MARLHNKVAMITGSAQGIGLAIAKAFVDEGAKVLLTDINNELGQVSANELGPNASYASLDVRDESSWQSAVQACVDRYGQLDILVNNAGITGFDHEPDQSEKTPHRHDPEHSTLEDWNRVHETNLTGTFLGCKHAIRAMRPRKSGSIINISSRSGLVGIPRAVAYASSKAAICNHTKSVALYCAEEGLDIRCNAIMPAAIMTPMWDATIGHGPDRDERAAAFVSSVPMRRFGTPEEVASLAIYLASDESGYTTGADFTIDGGILAGTANPPAPAKSSNG